LFNQLTASEVVTAIGVTLRGAARSESQASDFDRDQLMSAYSATRHLAVELATYEPELRAFARSVSEEIRRSTEAHSEPELAGLADRIAGSLEPGSIGEGLCEVFAVLRKSPSAESRALRARLHFHLRTLADREVDLLAQGLGR
jgi:hypothetical protein